MKKITAFLTLFLALTITLSAQNEVKTPEQEKTITKVSENIYAVEIKDTDGFIIQKGAYYKKDNELLPHGTWTLFSHKSTDVLTKIRYNKGEKQWLETKINGKVVRMNQNDITIHNLKRRIASLEKRIDSES